MPAPLISNINNTNNYNIFSHSSDNTGSKRDEVIDIYFCGSGFHNDLELGPTPLMTISREFLRDGAGSYIGINNKVNLTGKIYDSETPGISSILSKADSLKNLLRIGVGDLEVKKDGTGSNLLGNNAGKNARVTGYSIDKTPDHWVYTADYSVDFTYYEPIAKSDYRVSSITESWSLEPIGELVYIALSKSVQKRSETEPSSAASMSNVMVTGLPQFRLTRKLSAVGIRDTKFISHDKSSRHEFNNQSSDQDKAKNDAYLQAKRWIEDRLDMPFTTTFNNKGDYTTRISDSYNISSFTNLFVCNHSRNINFSITEGSYEVNDTWLALPSGVRHTEEFTIESSTDEKFIKTVRVQGIIKGLHVPKSNLILQNKDIPDEDTGKMNISKYADSGSSGSVGSKTFHSEKYKNALDAWIDDIKPSLYTRACLVLRSPDRTQDYFPAQYNGGTLPPGNPAFRKENLLNIIPISSSESHDTLKGAIGYTYEYNNSTKIFSGVIAESVSIDTTGPAHQMAEIFVLGRPLGPVMQDLGTKTACTKSVNIELIIPPPTSSAAFNMKNSSCPVWTGGYIFQTCEAIIEGQKPYGQRYSKNANLPNSTTKGVYTNTKGPYNGDVFVKSDNYSWNPSEGRYTRNIEWVYQPKSATNNDFLRIG